VTQKEDKPDRSVSGLDEDLAERDSAAVTRRPDDPGAHSGAKSDPQDRIVSRTASAEGYAHTGEGTAAAEPLKGVEKTDDEGRQPAADH
jgi:hypothetical protein